MISDMIYDIIYDKIHYMIYDMGVGGNLITSREVFGVNNILFVSAIRLLLPRIN